jgi:hypothetical protein
MAPTARFARNLADRLQNHGPSAPSNRQQPQPAPDGTWGTRDVAFFCKVSPGSVRKWIRTELIPSAGGRISDSVLRAILKHGLPLQKEAASVWPVPDLAADLHPEWAAEVA